MYITYIIQNDISNKYYIGSTVNLMRRLDEHNHGKTKSTKRNGNWILVYKEEYGTKKEAVEREKLIKSYKGGNGFKRLLRV